VTISSIHGNVYVNIPNNKAPFVNEAKNELNMNLISFNGSLDEANYALKNMEFEPLCPLDSDNIIQLKVKARAEDGLEASG